MISIPLHLHLVEGYTGHWQQASFPGNPASSFCWLLSLYRKPRDDMYFLSFDFLQDAASSVFPRTLPIGDLRRIKEEIGFLRRSFGRSGYLRDVLDGTLSRTWRPFFSDTSQDSFLNFYYDWPASMMSSSACSALFYKLILSCTRLITHRSLVLASIILQGTIYAINAPPVIGWA